MQFIVPANAATARADLAGDIFDAFRKHNVQTIDAPGLPGSVCAFGPDATVIIAPTEGKTARPFAAIAPLGKGRLIAIGHNGYFGDESKSRGDTKAMFEAFQDLAGVQLRMINASDITDESLASDEKFVRDGGTIIAGVPGWGWQQLNPSHSLHDMPANKLFGKAGIVFDSGTIDPPANHLFKIDFNSPPSKLLNAANAFEFLKSHPDDSKSTETKLAAMTLSRAVATIPADCDLMKRCMAFRATNPNASADAKLPMSHVFLAMDVSNRLADHAQPAAAASAKFPGAVADDVPRVSRTIEIDLSIPNWHGVGLYAPPGAAITISGVESPNKVRLAIRIGCHSDELWTLTNWPRAPQIDGVWHVNAGESTAMSNSFGGLIYVVVPEHANGHAKLTISGAIDSPRFVLGKTTDEEWKSKLRQLQSPWAELEGEKIIITVPSNAIRRLDDPTELMTWWDKVADCYADFAGIRHHRDRPERYVTDIEISAGYMHSGYPIMTHLDAAQRFVNFEKLSSTGDWGMFHELGHNHQQSDWTFEGTGEVTNNVFALYALDTVCSAGKIHEAMEAKSRADATAKYRSNGSNFNEWKSQPFTALIMYKQLQEAFGWDAYKKVFAEYRMLRPNERPKTDDDKRDQWMVRFSRTVGKNLGPFFESWDVPTSQSARDSINDLSAWMPAKE